MQLLRGKPSSNVAAGGVTRNDDAREVESVGIGDTGQLIQCRRNVAKKIRITAVRAAHATVLDVPDGKSRFG